MGLVDTKKTIMDKPLLWAGIGFVVVSLIILAVVVFLKMNNKEEAGLLAVVGEDKIYQKDLNEQIYGIDFQGSVSNPVAVDSKMKKQLLDTLIEWKIAEKEAAKLGITVSDEEVGNYIKSTLDGIYESDYTINQKELTEKNVKNNLLVNKLKDKVVGWKEGEFFVTRFDKAYEYEMDLNDPAIKQRLTDEKNYAQKLIVDLYNQIGNGKITFEDAMKKAESDTVIGKPTWGGDQATYTFSGKFSRGDSINRSIFHTSDKFWDEVFKIKKDEMMKPQLFNLNGSQGKHEAFFATIKTTDSNDSTYKSYTEWLDAMKKQYNVEYKVQF